MVQTKLTPEPSGPTQENLVKTYEKPEKTSFVALWFQFCYCNYIWVTVYRSSSRSLKFVKNLTVGASL